MKLTQLEQDKIALEREKLQLDAAKFEAEREDKQIGMLQDTAQFESKQTLDYTKLELENNVDIAGKGVNG